jgi:hypothetical protein
MGSDDQRQSGYQLSGYQLHQTLQPCAKARFYGQSLRVAVSLDLALRATAASRKVNSRPGQTRSRALIGR